MSKNASTESTEILEGGAVDLAEQIVTMLSGLNIAISGLERALEPVLSPDGGDEDGCPVAAPAHKAPLVDSLNSIYGMISNRVDDINTLRIRLRL